MSHKSIQELCKYDFSIAIMYIYNNKKIRVLLEKLTVPQPVNKFPAFYETRMFITAFTTARHMSLSWASSTHSPHPTFCRSILISFCHLRLGHPSGHFASSLPTKIMYVESSWNVMSHGDAWEGKWRGNWRMEWVGSTRHTTSEHGVSNITTADAHNSAASSRLNWRPCRFKWTRPFRRKTKSGFCACAITFQTQSTSLASHTSHMPRPYNTNTNVII